MTRSAKRDLDFCKLALECMYFSEETGNYWSLYAQIQAKNARMLKCPDQELLEEYNALLSRVSEARAYEQRFGEGSLLDLDHPSVKRLIRYGLINDERLMAAKARRESLSEIRLKPASAMIPSSFCRPGGGRKHSDGTFAT